MTVQSPHDRFFRHVFAQPEHAAGELRILLPAALTVRIDWQSLQLLPGTFVDPELRELRTDLLFSAQLDSGEEIRLYVLLEHQSTVDSRMPLRLLTYMTRIWAAYDREHPAPALLPAIIPCVVYANESGWTAPVAFTDLLGLDSAGLETVRGHVPSFSFLLDEVTPLRGEDLRQRAMTALAQVALHMLRSARPPADLTTDLLAWLDVLRNVFHSPNGVEAATTVLRYAKAVSETPPSNIRQIARRLGPQVEEALMTGDQILLEQGRVEGQAKGRVEGQASVLLRLLEKKFGPVPVEIVARVQSASVDDLDHCTEHLLSAASLDELFPS